MDGYERFKRRIQRASEEAIWHKLSTQYTFQLSDYLVQLRLLKIRAERRDRRELNNLTSESSTDTDDSEVDDDVVFDDEEPPLFPPLAVIIFNQSRVIFQIIHPPVSSQSQRKDPHPL